MYHSSLSVHSFVGLILLAGAPYPSNFRLSRTYAPVVPTCSIMWLSSHAFASLFAIIYFNPPSSLRPLPAPFVTPHLSCFPPSPSRLLCLAPHLIVSTQPFFARSPATTRPYGHSLVYLWSLRLALFAPLLRRIDLRPLSTLMSRLSSYSPFPFLPLPLRTNSHTLSTLSLYFPFGDVSYSQCYHRFHVLASISLGVGALSHSSFVAPSNHQCVLIPRPSISPSSSWLIPPGALLFDATPKSS